MTFTDKQMALPVEGLDVSSCLVAVQVIDRGFERGAITGQEAGVVADARKAMVAAVAKVTGVNFDEMRARAAVEQQKAVATAVPEVASETVEESEAPAASIKKKSSK